MNLEDYRANLGWSKARLAREASINVGTVIDAEKGKRVYKATAGKIANALSKGLGEGKEITYKDIEGLNLAD
ncbi:MAG: helix-turn-helix transcriptional regulator [Ktedonobacteraceae bacterium]|nr:helix-turn-helix transcriptional regulator [Ktedonobacteraceae bacterium]